MLRNARNLKGADVIASDGAIGAIDDFYFEDEKWTVRYLVVNTGSWLFSRDVLVSPISIEKVDESANQVLVSLSMDQVRNSPDIDTHKPVSRQHETAFMDYYGYPYYWGGPYLWGDSAFPATLAMPPAVESQMAAAATARRREAEDTFDLHLRSVDEVIGYYLEVDGDETGRVDDFIIDDRDWAIRFIVFNIDGWLTGRKVLISPRWIEEISWNQSKMIASLNREQIARSPEYDESSPVSREYEERLYNHYGRRRDG